MNKTKIEWVKNPDGTQGYTWNPITGCLNGCDYCYARKLANTRLKDRYLANLSVAPRFEGEVIVCEENLSDPFYPRFWEDRLLDPLKLKGRKQKGIFVCDMSDLFGIGIPEEWTRRVLNTIMADSELPKDEQDRFYLLTKQPQNLQKFKFPDNVWLGVSATDYWKYVDACNYLSRIEAKVKYISFEPLLSWDKKASYFFDSAGISWAIIGSQTKPTVMPQISWIQEIVRACDKAGVKVFLKNNLKPLIDKSPNIVGLTQYGSAKLRQELPNGKA